MIEKIDTQIFQILDFINDEDGSATYESIINHIDNFTKKEDAKTSDELDILVNRGFVQTYNDDGQVYYNITYKVRDLITENFYNKKGI